MSKKDFWTKHKRFCYFGLSRKGKGFGFSVYNALKANNYEIAVIHPFVDTINSVKCYNSVEELNQPIDAAVIVTGKNNALSAVKECYENGIKNIWIQQGSNNKSTQKFCDENKIKLYEGCVLMYNDSSFPHNIHAFIHNVFHKD